MGAETGGGADSFSALSSALDGADSLSATGGGSNSLSTVGGADSLSALLVKKCPWWE